jgi:hypothetical protein
MKTDDLITSLALDLPPTSRSEVDRRVLLFMLPAAGVALAGVVWWLGLRPDLVSAVAGPTFWLLDRLGRPGASPRRPAILLAAILAVAAGWAVVELLGAAPDARMDMVMGRSARVCPTNILSLGALAAPFIFLGARRFAPVKPASAGAAAGLLAAGLAATVYGLHCPEHTAAFVAVWYTLGMGLVAVLGAALGRFTFRW